jgi:hypothetical protein
MAERARTPPFLPQRNYLRIKVVLTAIASERPPLDWSRAWRRACAHNHGIPASTRHFLRVGLATHHRAQRHDRTKRLYVPLG